jgi:3-hydroxyisobutyrate dehydrogenase-like beta-hydroxyacid dehydrogenase
MTQLKPVAGDWMAPVGLLGAGLAGTALASRLVAGGVVLCAYDPVAEARDRVTLLGGTALGSEEEVAAQCRRLILSLPGPTEVRAVVQRIRGMLRPGDLVIDTTTGDPDSVEAIAEELGRDGVSYMDATLGGSSRQIAAGEAIVLCGALSHAYQQAEDLLRIIAAAVFHMGPPGAGTRMKLVLNLVLGLQRAVLAEGLEFARCSGIDVGRALEVLRAGPAYSKVMDVKGQKMLREDFQPEARLAQHWKDVVLMQQSAKENGALLPLTDVHEQLLREAIEAGWGGEDNSAILKLFRAGGWKG